LPAVWSHPAGQPRFCVRRCGFAANVSEVAEALTYVWHEQPVPVTLPVRQVYGYLLCPQTGRVLVQDVGAGKFNLIGVRAGSRGM